MAHAHTPGTRFRAAAATTRGPARERNEDAHLLQSADGLFVVCDGMAGGTGGDSASRMAAFTMCDEWRVRAQYTGGNRGDRQYGSRSEYLVEAVRQLNALIYANGQPEQGRMGTTVVCLSVQSDGASVVHVGDSRAYLWRNDRVERLTQDHTLWEALAREGLEDAWDNTQDDPRDILLRVVGGEPDVDVDVADVKVQSGDYFLLCTDGLTRIVPDTVLAASIARLREPQQICDALLHAALRGGATDDVTVAIVELVGYAE